MHAAVGTRLRFIFNKLIVIKDSDTLIFVNYNDIYKQFEKNEPRNFEFRITESKFHSRD